MRISFRFTRELLRKKKMTMEEYLDHNSKVPEMRGYNLLYEDEDLDVSLYRNRAELIDQPLNPKGVRFGASPDAVKSTMGKPFLIITKSDRRPGHQIWLYKRRIGNYKSTTQVHFQNAKVFLVVDELPRVFIPDVSFLNQLIDILGLETRHQPDKTSPEARNEGSAPARTLVFTDSKSRMLVMEEGVTIQLLWGNVQ